MHRRLCGWTTIFIGQKNTLTLLLPGAVTNNISKHSLERVAEARRPSRPFSDELEHILAIGAVGELRRKGNKEHVCRVWGQLFTQWQWNLPKQPNLNWIAVWPRPIQKLFWLIYKAQKFELARRYFGWGSTAAAVWRALGPLNLKKRLEWTAAFCIVTTRQSGS